MAYVHHVTNEPVVTTGPAVIDQGSVTVIRLVYFLADIMLVLLGLRLALQLLATNSTNELVDILYRLTAPLIAPFQNIFGSAILSNGSVVEWSTIIAMVAYSLIAYALVRLIQIMSTRT